MSTLSMTGNDTLVINNRVFNDFADDDVADVTFPNDIAAVKVGKNGNAIFALNESGKQCDIAMRVIRGSADDKFLNNLLAQQEANFAGFPLMIGEMVKQVGDGQGNVTADTYIISSGIFSKKPQMKTNVAGDTSQSVVMYHLKFAKAVRVLT